MNIIRVWTDDNPTRITLPSPSELGWQYSDVDKNSGRNDNGLMMRNRLAMKNKITLQWNAEKQPNFHAQMISILKTLPPFFYCEYPCPDGTTQTMECYRGDVKANLFRYDPVNGNIWKDTTVNFIER